MTEFLGELGMAKAGIWLHSEVWNPEKQAGIIRVNHKYVNELKAGLTFIQQIQNKDVIVRSLGVSGIINKAEKYIAS